MRNMIAVVLWLVLLVPAAAAQEECALPTRLVVGEGGRVLFTDGAPLNLRANAGRGHDVVDTLPEGARFIVAEGPVCADGIQWWRVESGGWAAEGTADGYFVEPMTLAQMQASAALEDRLAADSDTVLVLLDQNAEIHLTDLQLNTLETIPGAWNISVYNNRLRYQTADGIFVMALGGERTQVTPSTPGEGDQVGRSISADGTQIAYLYDLTVVEPTMMDDCRPEDGCLGKVYDLYVSDADGGNARRIWHGSTGDLTPLRLDRWRLDGGAVYLQSIPVQVASPNYPEEGVYFEILTDGTTPEFTQLGMPGLLLEQGMALIQTASDDGQWRVIYDGEQAVVSADGARYPVPEGIIQTQWAFSPDNRWLLWSEVVYGEGVDLAAVLYFRMDLTNGESELLWQFRDNLPGSTETGEIEGGLPFTLGWLADDLLLVTQRGHSYVFDVATGGSTHLDVPEGSALVGALW